MSLDRVIQTIRQRLVLSSLISRHLKLERRGQDLWGLCPFHPEKTASFKVRDDSGTYHCFGCGAHGDGLDFIQQIQNISFTEALELLAQSVGIVIPKQRENAPVSPMLDVLERACQWFQTQLHTPEENPARRYLQSRGISEAAVHAFRLGWASGKGLIAWGAKNGFSPDLLRQAGLICSRPGTNGWYEHMRERIVFPIMQEKGKVIGFGGRILGEGQPKYLNSPETSVFIKGHTLYGIPSIASHVAQCVVVEGYLDVIALHPHIPAVAPLGTAMGEDQLLQIWKKVDHVIVCFDGDDAGQKAMLRLALKALPLIQPGYQVSFCSLPPAMDPQNCIQTEGWPALSTKLQEAKPLAHFLWETLFVKNEGKALLPEEHAKKTAQWKEWIKTIQHGDVRRAYQTFFHTQRQLAFKERTSPFSAFIARTQRPSSPSLQLYFKALLGLLVWYPALLLEVQEDLGQWVPPTPRDSFFWSELRRFLLEWAEAPSLFSPTEPSSKNSTLTAYLDARLGQLWPPKLETCRHYIPSDLHPEHNPDLESLRVYWLEMLNQYRVTLGCREFRQSHENTLSDPPKSWGELVHLTHLTHLRRFEA